MRCHGSPTKERWHALKVHWLHSGPVRWSRQGLSQKTKEDYDHSWIVNICLRMMMGSVTEGFISNNIIVFSSICVIWKDNSHTYTCPWLYSLYYSTRDCRWLGIILDSTKQAMVTPDWRNILLQNTLKMLKSKIMYRYVSSCSALSIKHWMKTSFVIVGRYNRNRDKMYRPGKS